MRIFREYWDGRKIPNTGSIDDGMPSNIGNGGIPYEDDEDNEELNNDQLSLWADDRMDDLKRKGRKNWDMDDWEAYNYIQGVNAESDYFESKPAIPDDLVEVFDYVRPMDCVEDVELDGNNMIIFVGPSRVDELYAELCDEFPDVDIRLRDTYLYISSKSKRLSESELRPFTGKSWLDFSGAAKFPDGSSPMIAEGKFGTLIVGGPDNPDDDVVLVSIYFGSSGWGWKSYIDKETALKDARILVKLLDDEIDENQLRRFGFELV